MIKVNFKSQSNRMFSNGTSTDGYIFKGDKGGAYVRLDTMINYGSWIIEWLDENENNDHSKWNRFGLSEDQVNEMLTEMLMM